jgi:hypothetical protein
MIQPWRKICVIYAPDLKTWRQHRDAQSVLGILVILKVKLRLNTKKKLPAEDAANKHLIRAIARMGAREKMNIPVYGGNLDAEEILD